MTDESSVILDVIERHRMAAAMRKPGAERDALAVLIRHHEEIGRAEAMLAQCDAERSPGRVQALTRRIARARASLVSVSILADIAADGARRLAGDDMGPTVGTMVSRRADPISTLLTTGKISIDDERSAREIAMVYESVTSRLMATCGSMDSGGGGGGRQDMGPPERICRLYRDYWRPWAAWMQHPASRIGRRLHPDLGAVLDAVVWAMPLDTIRRQRRMAYPTCVRQIAGGLERYTALRARQSGRGRERSHLTPDSPPSW